MTLLALAAALFVLLHRALSGSALRGVIVRRTGEGAFQRLFALASVAALAFAWLAYQGARAEAGGWIIVPPLRSLLLQAPLQALAVFLIVTGLTTPGPTIAGMGDRLREGDAARGVLRVTRHPFLWGVALFSIGHMLAAPGPAAWLFFGALLVVALTGTFSIDVKRRRAFGDDWERFAARTSNLPFAAILAGRQTLKPGEIGLMRLVAAAAVFAALLALHPTVTGVRLAVNHQPA